MVRQPEERSAPSKARQAAVSSSSSLGRAIFLLPQYVVNLVFDLHTGIAARKTERNRCHFWSTSRQSSPFLPWIEEVDQQETAFLVTGPARSAKSSNLPNGRTVRSVRLRTLSKPRRVGPPRFARQCESGFPFSFIKVDGFVARGQ